MPGGRTKFKDSWLLEADRNGDNLGKWCKKIVTDAYSAYCIACRKSFSCSNSGIDQVLQHGKGKSHIAAMKDLKNCQELIVTEGTKGKPSLGLYIHSDAVIRAEIYWALHLAFTNQTFRSCDDNSMLFRAMFPDSQIVKDFSMARTKCAYIITDGIAPYFLAELVNEINNSKSPFVIHYDETTQCQVKKQLDLHIRYWSTIRVEVVCQFYKSIMFGHAKGVDVANSIISSLESDGFDLRLLVALGSDGPNVNKTIWRTIQGKLKESGYPGLLDIGTCNIHIVHNSFRKGLQYGLICKADQLIIDIHTFFHDSQSRREDLIEVQNQLNMPNLLPQKHCSSRWLSMGPAVSCLLDEFDVYLKYFKDVMKKPEKDQPKSRAYSRILVNLVQKPIEMKLELLFLRYVIPMFEGFLKIFQAKTPKIHVLYERLQELVTVFILRISNQSVFDGDHRELTDIPFRDPVHEIELEKLDIGTNARQFLLENFTKDKRKIHLLKMKEFYLRVIEHLLKTLPLSNKVLKCTSLVNPLNDPKTQDSNIQKLVTILGDARLKHSDQIRDEWKLYDLDPFMRNHRSSAAKSSIDRPDHYWKIVFDQTTCTGSKKYEGLEELIKIILVLPHGNADAERGFSENSYIVTDTRIPLSELTISSLRLVKDVVKVYGTPSQVPISKGLIKAVSGSFKSYELRIEKEKNKNMENTKIIEAQEEELMEKKRKLEQVQKETNDMQEKEEELRAEQAFFNEKIKSSQTILNTANEKLEKAIKEKNMKAISVAQMLLKSGHDENVNAQLKLDVIQGKLLNIEKKKHNMLKNLSKGIVSKQSRCDNIKSATPNPVIAKSATPNPVIAESATPKPVIAKSATPKPVIAKSATPKPVIAKSATPEPIQPRSSKTEPIKPKTSKTEPIKPKTSTPYPMKAKFIAPQAVPSENKSISTVQEASNIVESRSDPLGSQTASSSSKFKKYFPTKRVSKSKIDELKILKKVKKQ